uniref:Hemerythrin-like domain-containing protein n=1 Tax=Candidatus Kentrum sp. TUN TaxID=2126343 RepID=A0A450ZKB5_9GAMM|nr:MAG: Hemerythrin-like domain-containing protein [Candidatus Kentron sp. TUN]VFK59417.1 MAG: Hemerythrin-like domain-containing protein [Candidatus Kentron sp. TUN]VFK68567.1 MAG: Hemerythrin-like domain-containing protein [Candidatus Kentron sp. TUN]
MSKIIKQLHTDHVNMARLLDLMDEQLEVFQMGGTPDYVLMVDIMQYMANYPDLFHHPKENLIFERLVELKKSTRADVSEIVREHDVLTRLGEMFLNGLKAVVNEYPVERGNLESSARKYISTLRAHMNREEGHIFPVVLEMLQKEDWEEIDTAMGNMEDPLFGKKTVETEYLALYDYIQGCE